MKALACWLALGLCVSSFAQENSDLARAVQPLNEGVPEVAVVRLRALLGEKIPDDARRSATLKLGEALIASGRPGDALPLLNDPLVAGATDAIYLRAQAFAALSRWDDALPLYRAAASEAAFPQAAAAHFGEAEALRALGRTDEALAALDRLTNDPQWRVRAHFIATEILLAKKDPAGAKRMLDATEATTAGERKERRYLRGRVEWQANRSRRAIDMFASVLKRPQGASHAVLIATLCAIADAHLELGSPDLGDDYLEDFIEHQPDDPDLAILFAKLDQLYASERRQGRHELDRWARDPAQARRAFAQWYLARAELRLNHRDLALAVFERLLNDHPPLPAIAGAFLEYAKLEMEDGRPDRAGAILTAARALRPTPAMQARIDFMAARALYATQQFADAAKAFQRVAYEAPVDAKPALVNATLAFLSAGDQAQAGGAAQEVKTRGGDERTSGDLALEAALTAAARGEANAAELLQKFVRDFPKHPRVSEAFVSLAELAFRAAPPRLDEARQNLKRASESQPTPAAVERSDYLMIWLEDSGLKANPERSIKLAKEFLQQHPNSPLGPEVRLKLAETNFRRQDFASAQTQFELLAQQDPNGPLAERAQFFAAESAMNSMGKASLERALVLFDEVVKRSGDLKWSARNEQAVVERKLGKSEQAITLYDEVLRGDAKPAEKREALCGKGDVFFELGGTDPENYKRALEAYTQLASDREASAHWRNQAMFKKGVCLEKLHATEEALATFYGVVDEEGRPDRRREFFWFYKAGFNAARLLEEASKWQAAAAIYDKLASAGGARSPEAKSRLDRLRLEHFLWSE